MIRGIRQFSLVALALCFGIGGVGASYHQCEMDMPPAQEQSMAGMEDCDMQMPAKPVAAKKCCVDFSCPKCFSTPLYNAKQQDVQPRLLAMTLLLATAYNLPAHIPTAPERPPKIA